MADLVTLANAKAYLGVVHSDEDTLLALLISAVTAQVEAWTGAKFTNATFTEYLTGGTGSLVLPHVPITSITSIADHWNSDAVTPATDYQLDAESGLVRAVGEAMWSEGVRRWKVIYVGGYSGAPSDVQLAALMLIAGRYNRRDSLQSERLGDYNYSAEAGLPTEVRELLSPYRRVGF